MDPLTLKAIADLGISGYQTFKNIADIRQDRREELSAAGQAKQAGQEAYADLTEGSQFRVRQAPTKAADLTLSLAEQGLDRAQDRGSELLAGATANLGVDPRTGVASVQRLLGQLGQMEGAAEQRAAEQSVSAQKLIDDSIFNQQEAERRRLQGLKTQFELVPAMQEYTRATGAASALKNAERDAANQFVSDALASTTNLIAGMNRSTPDPAPDASKAREFAEYQLQNQLSQPIPIVDAEYDAEMARRQSTPVNTVDLSGIEPVSVEPEELVDEDLSNLYGVNTLSPTYQGLGPDSVLPPLSPLSQQVFGGMQGYNPLAFEDGGTYIGERGGMTGGDFDHDTNKKAIIDEKSGKKEGELTGGEAVFSEDHLADVVQMIKEGDEDGLFAYLKNLLQEPQFGYDFT